MMDRESEYNMVKDGEGRASAQSHNPFFRELNLFTFYRRLRTCPYPPNHDRKVVIGGCGQKSFPLPTQFSLKWMVSGLQGRKNNARQLYGYLY